MPPKLILLALSLLYSVLVIAEPKSDNIGLAWAYEKDGRSGTLLGSVHFADSSFYPLPGPIMEAYERSATLVVEVDDALVSPEQQQALMSQYGLYPKGETLLDHISIETLKSISPLLREFGLNLDTGAAGLKAALNATTTLTLDLAANKINLATIGKWK